MSYKLINKAKQPIVRTLADGTTLRIPIDGDTTITENQYDSEIEHLSEIGLLKVRKNELRKSQSVDTEANEQNKKEDKKDAKS